MTTSTGVKPTVPKDEAERLLALRQFKILDTPPELELDDITFLASQICNKPIAMISLVDEHRQWFKSKIGISSTETPRDVAFCAHAIHGTETFIVEDASLDHRFKNNPLVLDNPHVKFYAGAVLRTSTGHNIGTLCVIDHIAGHLTPNQIRSLEALARQVILNFEKKILNSTLQQREHFLTNVFGMIPDLVSYLDPQFCYRYVNLSYEAWFGIPSRQVIGQSMQDLIGAEAFQKVRPYLVKALTGETQEYQAVLPYLIRGETCLKTIRARYIPDLDESGKVLGVFSVVTDITRLKEAEMNAIKKGQELEHALEQSVANERAFRAIYDNSPIGIIQVDSNLKIVAANPAYCTFLGYTEDEIKTKTILDLTHPDDVKITSDAVSTFSNKGKALNRFEKRYLNKSGDTVWGLVTSRAIRLVDHGEQYLFSVIEDITEIKDHEQSLKEAQAMLVASAKMASLGEMASGVAHEINNPLAIIGARAEILKLNAEKGLLDPSKLVQGLNTITFTVERIASIIRGLRSFARSSGRDPKERVPLTNILDDTLMLCVERFRGGGVALRLKLKDDCILECRQTEVSQILMNLLNNAFDAVQNLDDKWIQIEVLERNHKVSVHIIDSGTGIDPAVVSKMMEPFFTTKAVGKGTGLGLSISQGLANSNGGKLYYLANQPHTTFVLELPLTETHS